MVFDFTKFFISRGCLVKFSGVETCGSGSSHDNMEASLYVANKCIIRKSFSTIGIKSVLAEQCTELN